MSPDETQIFSKKNATFVQYIVGSFLYYGRSIDVTILPKLNEISLQQYKPTKNIKEKYQLLMDYISKCPDTYI